jgi:hypothetical protein
MHTIIPISRKQDKEITHLLQKNLKEAAADESNVRLLIFEEDGEKLEAILIPNSPHFKKIIQSILSSKYLSAEFNLDDPGLNPQMALNIMGIDISNGERKVVLCEKASASPVNIQFLMMSPSVFESFNK